MSDLVRTRIINRRALFVLIILLALLVFAIGSAAVAFVTRQINEDGRNSLQMEMQILGEISLDSLLRSDYASVERLVSTWAMQHKNINQIKVTLPNGFVLADIRNNALGKDTIKLEQAISYKGTLQLTMLAESDLTERRNSYTHIINNAMIVVLFLVGIFGFILWRTLQRTALDPLAQQIRIREDKERELLQRTIQLETANRELESFSYSVSHDLRAPLRAVDGFSRALLEDYSDRFDQTGREYLERIRRGAQTMGSLIDDLLKLSRVSRAPMKFEEIDLSAMAQQILSELQQIAPERQITIQIAPGLHSVADRGLMRIALENLLQNAWKYTSKNPNPSIEIGVAMEGQERVCYIKDNGVGFDMRYAEKLFGPFQRLHKTEDYPGTGIGLATVLRIIQRHGGRIWAYSEEGLGATFYFSCQQLQQRQTGDNKKLESEALAQQPAA